MIATHCAYKCDLLAATITATLKILALQSSNLCKTLYMCEMLKLEPSLELEQSN